MNDELRRLAGLYLLRERRHHTRQTTALVHEAYLRLVDQRQVNWKNRAQFVGLAAVMMRRSALPWPGTLLGVPKRPVQSLVLCEET